MGIKATLEEVKRVVGQGPTYVSFDIDSLDPAFAPGTGTPEIGGLTTIQAQALIRGLAGLNLIGGDLVEVSPPFDPTGNTALVGATMLYEVACVLTDAVARKKINLKWIDQSELGSIHILRGCYAWFCTSDLT